MPEYTIYPILGLKTDVPQDDPSLFQVIAENVAATHDVGGLNVDYNRTRNAATKSKGYVQYSSAANSEATKCLGLFQLRGSIRTNHFYFDNGKVFKLNPNTLALDEVEAGPSNPVTFGNADEDLYSCIQVGDYMVFSDNGNVIPYKWQHGDVRVTPFIPAGNTGHSYRFKYLESFQRRVVGAYAVGASNGDIDVRWTDAWPTAAVDNLTFADGNQLYIPNDDSITGIRRMGRDRCFLYSRNSIHSLDYVPDYYTPFRFRNVVEGHGSINHHGIISYRNSHYLFSENVGFCEFRGAEFPVGGKPFIDYLDLDLRSVNKEHLKYMVGKVLPMEETLVWTLPINSSTSNRFVFYNLITGQWWMEDKAQRFIDNWQVNPSYTWSEFITALGGAGSLWSAAASNYWTDYLPAAIDVLAYGNTDGHVYYSDGEDLNGSAIDAYRIEPILDFGNPRRKDLIVEIWFGLGVSDDFYLDLYHRSGDTRGEVIGASWEKIGEINCESPEKAMLPTGKSARLHQIKWGSDAADEKFEVNYITFNFQPQSER